MRHRPAYNKTFSWLQRKVWVREDCCHGGKKYGSQEATATLTTARKDLESICMWSDSFWLLLCKSRWCYLVFFKFTVYISLSQIVIILIYDLIFAKPNKLVLRSWFIVISISFCSPDCTGWQYNPSNTVGKEDNQSKDSFMLIRLTSPGQKSLKNRFPFLRNI